MGSGKSRPFLDPPSQPRTRRSPLVGVQRESCTPTDATQHSFCVRPHPHPVVKGCPCAAGPEQGPMEGQQGDEH